MTRFLLIQNDGATLACDRPMSEWSPEDIRAHIAFQVALNKELAAYRMVDVESEARAIEIAAKASAAPGPGGVPIQQPIEVREVMGPPRGDM